MTSVNASGDMISESSMSAALLAANYPDDLLGDQWSHPELQTATTMRGRVDAVLNAGAAYARTLLTPHLRVVSHSGAAVGAVVAYPFEIVREDTESAWNPVSHHYTITRSGLWLVSAAVVASDSNAANVQISLRGLDATIYPDIALYGNKTPGGERDCSRIPACPIRLQAGDVVWIRNHVAFTPYGTGGVVDRHYFDLSYLGQ